MNADRVADDPIFLEVLRHALGSLVDEMALVVARTSRSATVRDALDYSTALCATDGTMLAQGLGIALHLGSFPSAVSAVSTAYEGRIDDGDVFVLNDPYGWGGIHLPDIYVLRPIFADGGLVAFACVVAHHADVGGIVAGSNSTAATEVYQEGIRIPGVKLFERGVRNDALMDVITANVRVPDQFAGDLGAQLAATSMGERAYLRLVAQHGLEAVTIGGEALLDQAEARARAAIAAMPRGRYAFRTYIDHDSVDPDPVTISAEVTVDGDSLTVDLRGSSTQVRGGINSPLPFSRSGVYAAIRLVLGQDIPDNAGYFRPIRVLTEPGSVVDPVLPGACGARGITGFRVLEAVLGAMAQAVPERVPADGEGGNTLISLGGSGADGPFVYTELFAGARGGSIRDDGPEGVPHPGSNNANMPVEVAEATYPMRFETYGIVPDTGGAGQHRGAMALVRQFTWSGPPTTLQLRSDKRRHPPYGLSGGAPGSPSETVINPGTDHERILPTIGPSSIDTDDVFRHVLAAGGGWGDPLTREPARVRADVRSEKVTPAAALRDHGVVIDADGVLDQAATDRVRSDRALPAPSRDDGGDADTGDADTGDER